MTDTGLWVINGPGLPCGARPTAAMGAAPARKMWLDVCILGQHLPQMYRKEETRRLDAAGCARLGLCPDCLGFGDLGPAARDPLAVARGIDGVARPCARCGGSGRPALRVTVNRDGSGGVVTLDPLPHVYAPPLDRAARAGLTVTLDLPEGSCLACGMPPDGIGPGGAQLHAGAGLVP